jgi:primosomal protein N' (replication factor Y)
MLHAEVALDIGGAHGGCLTYRIPEHMPVRAGDIVLVPVSSRMLPGVVVSIAGQTPSFPTRPVEDRLAEDAFLGPLQLTLARWIAAHYRASLFDSLAMFLPPGLTSRLTQAAKSGRWKSPTLEGPSVDVEKPAPTPGPPLTPHQERAARSIIEAVDTQRHQAFLLHGVTGSGKTLVYMAAIERVLELGRQAIVLVPEIAITPQTVERFEARFPGRVQVLHSDLKDSEHRRAWERIRRGEADIVIGARSALFAPVRRPGIVVLDEEHEWAYKQDRPPRYHAREVALWWGQIARAPVVLGSATPDVESTYRVERGRYTLLTLPTRFVTGRGTAGSELPPVELVDMRSELKAGNSSIFSRALRDGLRETLERGEQALLFLNRRGAATHVSCRDCGHVVKCRRCDVPLAYHRTEPGLLCHRCSRREQAPDRCPACHGSRIRFLGLGTQRVESELATEFPKARVIRWDRDTTTSRGSHDRVWAEFASGKADVLVGTQMVAKALDFPRVTLVGAILADVALYLPDLRAGERTFQLLTQVAGRGGRSTLGGRAIIQTYSPDHYAIRAAAKHDYAGFFRREIAFRRAHGYPPLERMVQLVYSHSNELAAQRQAASVARRLTEMVTAQGIGDIRLVGPAPCYLQRVRGRSRWQIVLLGDRFARLLDKLELPPGWSLDVDPLTLL